MYSYLDNAEYRDSFIQSQAFSRMLRPEEIEKPRTFSLPVVEPVAELTRLFPVARFPASFGMTCVRSKAACPKSSWPAPFAGGWAPTTRSLGTNCTARSTACFQPGETIQLEGPAVIMVSINNSPLQSYRVEKKLETNNDDSRRKRYSSQMGNVGVTAGSARQNMWYFI